MTETDALTQQGQTDSRACFINRIGSSLTSSLNRSNAPKPFYAPLPQPSQARLDASLTDTPLDTEKLEASSTPSTQEKVKTVFYLAYGSNLCNETFRGVRGIRPLSQVNVLVPSLRLTFDLPGIPYKEPCFANTALRKPESQDYHKDRWHKGLVGVVYEVTLSDYAHIIATEGGGSAYHDILVDCHVLPPSDTVPSTPDSKPFKAHTLFAPLLDKEGQTQSIDRVTRPDPSYAQPSARYLKLITDGATECELPAEYQNYLHDIRTYTITTKAQETGKALFLAIFMPFLAFVFGLAKMMQDKKGRSPWWLAKLSAMLFTSMWLSYDTVFKGMFGDGERTVGDEELQGRDNWDHVILGKHDAEKEGLLEDFAANEADATRRDASRAW